MEIRSSKHSPMISRIAFSILLFTGISASSFGGEHTPWRIPHGCEPVAYVFGYGGIALSYDEDLDGRNGVFGTTFEYDFDDGYTVGGGIGLYANLFGGSRLEIEGYYSKNNLASAFPAGTPIPTPRDMTVEAIFFNFLKEFPCGCFTAYAGGGLGYASTQLNAGTAPPDDSAFASQVIVGVDYPLSQCLSLFTQYKLVGINETDYHFGVAAANGIHSDGWLIHNFMVGARYSF